METIIKSLIYIHAFFGGVGLITGIGSAIVKKGGKNHKLLGRIFSYSMVISSLISLFVARMPNHENLFLFLIGTFTIYLVLSGNRALTFKSRTKQKAAVLDKLISGTMFFISLLMIIVGTGTIGIFQQSSGSILYLFFGVFGIFMSAKDFYIYRTFKNDKTAWVKSHIGRMVGALIASVTAFLVAGIKLDYLIVWIAPSVIGTVYIIYWQRKFKKKPKSTTLAKN
jgi:uncharacterized membrane protein